jgi:hypothetical protein
VSQCFHFVSNRSSFEAVLGQGDNAERVRLQRRAAVIDSVRRFVRKDLTS